MSSESSQCAPACPYAARGSEKLPPPSAEVEEDEEPTSPNSSGGVLSRVSSRVGQISTSEALSLARSKCPAFRNGACPFRDAHSKNELLAKLKDIPTSHYNQDDVTSLGSTDVSEQSADSSISHDGRHGSKGDISVPFMVALEHVQHVSKNLISNEKDGFLPDVTWNAVDMVNSLECFSMSAILAKMVRKEEGPSNSRPRSGSTSTVDTTGTDDTREKLSTALKNGTASSHKSAEDVRFVRNFIRGVIPRDLYAGLVSDLYFIYETLEEELDRHGPSLFPSLHHPEKLSRLASLERDMRFFHGVDWKDTVRPSPATLDYAERIRLLGATSPILLLAHAYTRYLGDLSGGRVLRSKAKKALHLQGEGLAFYEFENIKEGPIKFKEEYRNALDELVLTEDEVTGLVREANVAFVLNIRIFQELDVMSGTVEGSEVMSMEEALRIADIVEEGDGKCPFLENKKNKANNSNHTLNSTLNKQCPWPFILMHSPEQGMKDFKTWIVIGLALCWLWKCISV